MNVGLKYVVCFYIVLFFSLCYCNNNNDVFYSASIRLDKVSWLRYLNCTINIDNYKESTNSK